MKYFLTLLLFLSLKSYAQTNIANSCYEKAMNSWSHYIGDAKVMYENQDRGSCDVIIGYNFTPRTSSTSDAVHFTYEVQCQMNQPGVQGLIYGTGMGSYYTWNLISGQVNPYPGWSGSYSDHEINVAYDYNNEPKYSETTNLKWSEDCSKVTFTRTEQRKAGLVSVQGTLVKQ